MWFVESQSLLSVSCIENITKICNYKNIATLESFIKIIAATILSNIADYWFKLLTTFVLLPGGKATRNGNTPNKLKKSLRPYTHTLSPQNLRSVFPAFSHIPRKPANWVTATKRTMYQITTRRV